MVQFIQDVIDAIQESGISSWDIAGAVAIVLIARKGRFGILTCSRQRSRSMAYTALGDTQLAPEAASADGSASITKLASTALPKK